MIAGRLKGNSFLEREHDSRPRRSLAPAARLLQANPEIALRRAGGKFIGRYTALEARLAEKGKKPSELTLAEMDAVWDEVNPFDSPVLARPGPGFPVPVLPALPALPRAVARPGPGDAQG